MADGNFESQTVRDLVRKYGSEGKAAGAVALGIEKVTVANFVWWPETFRSLILFKQNTALLKLTAIAAGTSLERLHAEWQRQELPAVRESEDLDDGA